MKNWEWEWAVQLQRITQQYYAMTNGERNKTPFSSDSVSKTKIEVYKILYQNSFVHGRNVFCHFRQIINRNVLSWACMFGCKCNKIGRMAGDAGTNHSKNPSPSMVRSMLRVDDSTRSVPGNHDNVKHPILQIQTRTKAHTHSYQICLSNFDGLTQAEGTLSLIAGLMVLFFWFSCIFFPSISSSVWSSHHFRMYSIIVWVPLLCRCLH